MNYFLFLNLKKTHWIQVGSWSLYYKVKQTKINLQKYFHPFSSNHLMYAHKQCREPKKVSRRFYTVIFKKTPLLCPSRSYYSMTRGPVLRFIESFRFFKEEESYQKCMKPEYSSPTVTIYKRQERIEVFSANPRF